MKPSRLFVLLPCESLESFDLHRSESDAEQLLSAWSALWHPALLAAAQSIPQWAAATAPPEPSDFLAIVPECCEPSLPQDWTAAAEAAGACVLRGLKNRQEMLAAAIEGAGTLDQELAADFLALGYCHMLVELIASRTRYMSNLNEASLQSAALAAAEAAVAGDAESARRQLQAAFDRLHEAREYHYAVEPRLLDLTLLAPSTLGQPLRDELAADQPRSLLVSGQVVELMARQEPETLDALKRALAGDTASLVGGEFAEVAVAAARAGVDLASNFAADWRATNGIWAAGRPSLGGGGSGSAPRCRKSSAGWASPPPSIARSTTANSPPAARAESNGKALTAAPSRRSAACRWTPAGRNRSSWWPKSLPRRASSTTRPRWCLPIGRAGPAVGMTICGASLPIAPSWGGS